MSLPMAYAAKRATMKKSSNIKPGESTNLASESSDEHYSSIADAILRQKKNSDPGQADMDANNAENSVDPHSPFDDQSHEATMKELYSVDDQLESDSDSKDMFEAIKRKRR